MKTASRAITDIPLASQLLIHHRVVTRGREAKLSTDNPSMCQCPCPATKDTYGTPQRVVGVSTVAGLHHPHVVTVASDQTDVKITAATTTTVGI